MVVDEATRDKQTLSWSDEGILYRNSRDGLAMIHVFGENSCRADLDSRGNDQRIPKADPCSIFDKKSLPDIGWSGDNAPVREVLNNCARLVFRKR